MPALTCKVVQGERFPSALKTILALEVYPGSSKEASNFRFSLRDVSTLSSFRIPVTHGVGGSQGAIDIIENF